MNASKRSLSTFRIHLLLTAACAIVGFAIVIAAAMFAPLFTLLDRAGDDRVAIGGIADYIIYLHSSYWPVVAVMVAASVVSGMLMFRKMSQPLVRFLESFRGLERGEIREIRSLRRADYLHPEAEALNTALCAILARAEADEQDLIRIEKALHELSQWVQEPRATEAVSDSRDALESLRSRLPRRA